MSCLGTQKDDLSRRPTMLVPIGFELTHLTRSTSLYFPREYFRTYLFAMVGSPSAGKRKFTSDRAISPPPLRRKVQSGTTRKVPFTNSKLSVNLFDTEDAVSSFFTPASKKPPEKITWHERRVNDDTPSTLLVGKYVP